MHIAVARAVSRSSSQTGKRVCRAWPVEHRSQAWEGSIVGDFVPSGRARLLEAESASDSGDDRKQTDKIDSVTRDIPSSLKAMDRLVSSRRGES